MAPSRRRRLLAFAGALAMPLALACNGIIGLSDYDRVECTGGKCDGGTSPDGNVGDGASDGARPDGRVDASGTKPVSWAAWRMPNYDAGDATDNLMAYVPTTDGFQDTITKLVWRHPMSVEAGNQTFEGAVKLCASLAPAGSWRMPSRIELVTLLDLSRSGAKVDPTFAGTVQGPHWTFSEVRPFDPIARPHWIVDFGSGGLTKRDEAGLAAVKCVKDGP